MCVAFFVDCFQGISYKGIKFIAKPHKNQCKSFEMKFLKIFKKVFTRQSSLNNSNWTGILK